MNNIKKVYEKDVPLAKNIARGQNLHHISYDNRK